MCLQAKKPLVSQQFYQFGSTGENKEAELFIGSRPNDICNPINLFPF